MNNRLLPRKKSYEDEMILARRLRVADLHYRGKTVDEIKAAVGVERSTIFNDLKYIEDHAEDILHNFVVKTIPSIITKLLVDWIRLIERHGR